MKRNASPAATIPARRFLQGARLALIVGFTAISTTAQAGICQLENNSVKDCLTDPESLLTAFAAIQIDSLEGRVVQPGFRCMAQGLGEIVRVSNIIFVPKYVIEIRDSARRIEAARRSGARDLGRPDYITVSDTTPINCKPMNPAESSRFMSNQFEELTWGMRVDPRFLESRRTFLDRLVDSYSQLPTINRQAIEQIRLSLTTRQQPALDLAAAEAPIGRGLQPSKRIDAIRQNGVLQSLSIDQGLREGVCIEADGAAFCVGMKGYLHIPFTRPQDAPRTRPFVVIAGIQANGRLVVHERRANQTVRSHSDVSPSQLAASFGCTSDRRACVGHSFLHVATGRPVTVVGIFADDKLAVQFDGTDVVAAKISLDMLARTRIQ
jgi:hypothetical protein